MTVLSGVNWGEGGEKEREREGEGEGGEREREREGRGRRGERGERGEGRRGKERGDRERGIVQPTTLMLRVPETGCC